MINDKRGYSILASLLFVFMAPFLAMACGTGDERITEITTQVQSLQQQLEDITTEIEGNKSASQVSQVISAIHHLDSADLHNMNADILAGKELNPRWADKLSKLIAVTKATTWPGDLEELAKIFVQATEELENVLIAEDASAAVDHSTAAHGTWHGLSHAVYVWLLGEEMDHEEMDHGMSMK